jgi:hypothetical protein
VLFVGVGGPALSWILPSEDSIDNVLDAIELLQLVGSFEEG